MGKKLQNTRPIARRRDKSADCCRAFVVAE